MKFLLWMLILDVFFLILFGITILYENAEKRKELIRRNRKQAEKIAELSRALDEARLETKIAKWESERK